MLLPYSSTISTEQILSKISFNDVVLIFSNFFNVYMFNVLK